MSISKIVAGIIGVVVAGALTFGVLFVKEFFSWIDDMYWQNQDEEMEAEENGFK